MVDSACYRNEWMCKEGQREAAETVAAIRSTEYEDIDGVSYPMMRTSYIEFGHVDPDVVIPMNDEFYNKDIDETNAEERRVDLYNAIKYSDICDNQDKTKLNLYDALEVALNQFDEEPTTTEDLQRDRKILIFSTCAVNATEKNRTCDRYEDWIRTGSDTNEERKGIDVVMVNTQGMEHAGRYIECLVEYDFTRIFVRPEAAEGNEFIIDTLPLIRYILHVSVDGYVTLCNL